MPYCIEIMSRIQRSTTIHWHLLLVILVLMLAGRVAAQYEHVDEAYDLWNSQEPQIGVGIHPFIEGGYLAFSNAFMEADGVGPFPYLVFLDAFAHRTSDQVILPSVGFESMTLSGFDGVDHQDGNGYMLCGTEVSTPYALTGFIAHFNLVGQELWRRHVTFPGADGSECHKVCFTSDGGCVVLGVKHQGDGITTWIVRHDAVGNELWRQNWNQVQVSTSMPLPDDGFMVTGCKTLNGVNVGWYGHLDADGDLLWEHTMVPSEPASRIVDVAAVGDSGYALLDVVDSTDVAYDWIHFRRYSISLVDGGGQEFWRSSLGEFSEHTGIFGIKYIPGAGVVGHGISMSDMGTFGTVPCGYLVGVDLVGENLWSGVYQHSFAADSLTTHGRFYDVLVDTLTQRLICVGGVTGRLVQQEWLTDEDLWIYTTDYWGCIEEDCAQQSNLTVGIDDLDSDEMAVSPNPIAFGEVLNVRLPANVELPNGRVASVDLMSIDGRTLQSGSVSFNAARNGSFVLTSVAAGHYVLRVRGEGNGRLTVPLIVE